ncbi:transcriptional regulator [Streptomyces cinnamoneus]|uniref:Transcriptional regulator n=2 Tax=Streptomyces cinnamoneus TaxID=53446 RepID=A0A2G1XGR4_STRCJ|nr:helix-turn-helix transcriptional regulator [Streptomyces cinnamoneus]PHQ50405.1 transcriptional regulator [Streptomyces cinnamoneus]PPT16449.1 XRE family transcriptional regulator [Streptomyces cinnamoneus]
MSRRARVSPAEAGLPDGGARRRTPGLRREEVAVLAGVGASWYQWLEQGRDITVSPQVLDAVAGVLRLSGPERRHLYVLAGLNPPLPESEYETGYVCDSLKRLIDGWAPFPAHIMDPYWNLVAYNEPAGLVMGFRPKARQNCLVDFFTDPVYRSRAANWEQNAPRVVAQYRAACSEHRGGDEGFEEIVEELAAVSPEFVRLWARRDVQPAGMLVKEFQHPLVGTLHMESTSLSVPARPDLRLCLHNPVQGTGTAEKLQWLDSPEGRRGGMSSVAG